MSILSHRVVPALLSVSLCALVIAMWACTPQRPVLPSQPVPAPLNGAALEPPVNLPDLSFVRTDGGTFTTADTAGRTSLFYFGYTHCPDMCPLTLAELSHLRRSLCTSANQVDMYFVTLDLPRDTPGRMREYVANFPGVVGLIGSDAQLAEAQAAFNVVATRRDMGNGEYLLDHAAAIYLVNRSNQIQLAYPYGTDPSEIASDLSQLA